MKMTLHEQLTEEKIRFFKMINGLIAGGFFVGLALLLYKIMKVLFA